jgi:molybdenum cofactor cytidylyltransferase
MGSPKALLRLGGRTFLERILGVVDECSISHRVVVVGGNASEIISHAPSVPVVHNPDYAAGMTTSFQAGIRALPPGVEGVVVFLVDHPLVSASTVRALLGQRGRGDVLVPVHGGRRGHPVFFSRKFTDEIMALGPDVGVNALIRSRPESVVEVPVQDSGILTDVDTPGDFGRLQAPPES